MPNITDTPPAPVQRNIAALRASLNTAIPPRRMDQNLLIATWNIRGFGNITREWASGPKDSPRRDLHAVLCIAEIISHFDVVAVQEVKGNIRGLRDTLKVLGEDWGLILTDVTRGSEGNDERMAFLFNTKRVRLSGLACELVVSLEELNSVDENSLKKQFARTPYAVGFKSSGVTFVLTTLHILYGNKAMDRIPELKAIAKWMANWAKEMNEYEQNLIVLGDFNIEDRGDLLHKTFISEGLHIHPDMMKPEVTRSIFNKTKFYDHIAWFDASAAKLSLEFNQGGNFDFLGTALLDRGLSKTNISFMISDHYPLWAEFKVNKI
jgi:endonuclease/exonuclease/phosphatase family metal-dependent hydrolase